MWEELIPKIFVERFKIIGELYVRFTIAIERRYAVVEVFRIGRFDEGVEEEFGARCERVVDHERSRTLCKRTRYREIASKFHIACKRYRRMHAILIHILDDYDAWRS